ncbi:hypothetical protein LXL04_008145 [Taraxacum kok-saghyz]
MLPLYVVSHNYESLHCYFLNSSLYSSLLSMVWKAKRMLNIGSERRLKKAAGHGDELVRDMVIRIYTIADRAYECAKSLCRQFVVGWLTVLDSVPEIDMHDFLPDFLDGNEKGIAGKFVGLN